MTCCHFYHVYCAGRWQEPASEHLWALKRYGFDGPVVLGLFGPRDERRLVRRTFQAALDRKIFTVEAADGWEQHTLHAIREHAQANDGSVFYAHTKGATNHHGLQRFWRQAMDHKLLRDWREYAAMVESGTVDAVGCHWLDPEEWPDGRFVGPTPHFGGNFWIASCAYLRTLPECAMGTRWDAERWIGLANPRVINLLEGWPNSTRDCPPLGAGRLQVMIDGALSPPLR